MTKVRVTVGLVALSAMGCVTPRSLTVGQMAAPIGRGATEVSVFGGLAYGTQTDPPTSGVDVSGLPTQSQVQHRVFAAPGAEANIQHGFDEHVALNVHASAAGVQPGLKWTLNKSRIAHVALLPAIGLGYASYANSTFFSGSDGLQTEIAPTTTTSFTFLGGLKFLVSHRSGFYAGVGYDLLFNRSVVTVERGEATTGDESQRATQTLSHQISAAVGFDVALGMVHLRPEIAFAAYPGISNYITVKTPPNSPDPVAGTGGFGWAIMPGFSLAVQSPQRELTDEEKEEAQAKVKKRRKSDGDSDDDEDESAPRKHRDDDEDDDRPRNKKRHLDDDEF